GPAMIRSAAKNHAAVGVVVDPADYDDVARALESHGTLDQATRRRLALKAFAHTAAYDAAIHETLARRFEAAPESDAVFPPRLRLEWERTLVLRYGENPHQRGALYAAAGSAPGSVARARKLQGKELSFNNLLDLDAAWRLVSEFEAPAAVLVKHNNPCGVA